MRMDEFVFPNKLMQEHFNENYMESTKYPAGTFSGKIDQPIDLSKDGTYEVTATGDFTVHGVKKSRQLKGKLQVNNGKIAIDTQFDVALKDHNIDVPTIVFVKIAQIIQVNAKILLE
jgi:polyisoprenoid-binding protein YceI